MQPNLELSPRTETRQGMARITGQVTDTWLLDGIDGPARRAASCHLRPGVGDRVWFVREGDDCFITAVLERACPASPSTLDLGEDVKLHTTGTLEVHATDELRIRAPRATAAVQHISVFAKTAVSHIAKRTLVGSVLEQVLDRFTSHTKTSQRTVDGLDQLQARDVDHRAQSTLSLGGEHTLLKGRTLIKADGDQIHIG